MPIKQKKKKIQIMLRENMVIVIDSNIMLKKIYFLLLV